jgi:flagellar protein FliJ
MAESRAKRMQVVVFLAERKEQEAGRQLGAQQTLIATEEQQLRELEAYATQYLQTYSARKNDVRPHELIAFSGFIQRLGAACKEQEAKVLRQQAVLERLQHLWRIAHHKHEAIKALKERLAHAENLASDKQFQKEVDDIVCQHYARKEL